MSALKAKVFILLKNRSRMLTIDDIAKQTNINKYWLSSFSRGKIKEPSVSCLEILYDFFTGTKISDKI